MRPEQHKGKLSQLLTQTLHWVKKTEDGWDGGGDGDGGKNVGEEWLRVKECSVSALQQWQLMLTLSSIDRAEEVFTLESIIKFISIADNPPSTPHPSAERGSLAWVEEGLWGEEMFHTL